VIVAGFVDHQFRDESLIGKIAEELCHVADQAQQHLVVDLSGVVHLSSLMLGKLVMLQIRMKKKDGDLMLRKVGPEVRDILATTALDRTLHIEEEEAAASEAFA
jgi:anti-anti-sigma factor